MFFKTTKNSLENYRELIVSACNILDERYHPEKHKNASALECTDGTIINGINVKATGGGPCAEISALSNALVNGYSKFNRIVTVRFNENKELFVVSPCGMCRQMIYDYCPTTKVLLPWEESQNTQNIIEINSKVHPKLIDQKLVAATIDEILPYAFKSKFAKEL
jgi:cytidine deaminase